MPILVETKDLQPGMRLYDAFTHRGRVMLPGGRRLTATDIDSVLRRFSGVRLRIGHPILDSMVEFEDDTYERDIARQAQSSVARAVTSVERQLSTHCELTPRDFETLSVSSRQVMRFLAENPVSAAIICKTIGEDRASYLAEHTAAVLFLAMSLGQAVKSYVATERQRQTNARDLDPAVAFDLTPLGLGAMFMDIGMFALSDLCRERRDQLTDDERRRLIQHPHAGAEMLPDSFPPAARLIVRTHHENYDGSGYPARIPGDRQHIFTRIVRICDSFHAATASHLHREPKSPARVIWEMTAGPTKRFYDPVLAKVFASLIQPFPIGAVLKLEDGREGVVVRFNRRNPFRPVIVIITDDRAVPLPAHKVRRPTRLDALPDLRLASFGDEDLSYLNELPDLATPFEPLGRERFDTLTAALYP